MRKFKDALDREWTLSVNMHTAIQLRTEADFEIKDVLDPKNTVLARLAADSEFLGGVLWVLVSDQADEHKITQKSFFSALVGDHLGAVTDSLVAECFDFFPLQQRLPLQKAWEKAKRISQQLSDEMAQELDRMTDEKLIELAKQQMKEMSTGAEPDLKSPESSESTPAP